MRIAYCGNFSSLWTTENDVRKAFEYLGHEVIQLQENKVTIDQVREAGLNADLFLITGTWDSLPLTDMLDFYHDCALKNIPTVTLHLDTFWGTGRGNRKWWRESMFHTGFIMTADGDYEKEWKLFGKNHIWLPPAIRHDAAHFGKYREEYNYDVGFAGSNGVGYHEDVWPYRKQLVDNLREICKRNNWSFHNPGGDHPKVERGEDMNDWYASVKVTVGDSLCLKKEKSKYWSDRVPEATGRGGFLIMPYIQKLSEIYKMPFYKWGNFADLESTIHYSLENREEVDVRRQHDHKLTKENHTYVNRAQTILKTVGLK